MRDVLYVMYLSDNNYAPYAGISITSLFEKNKDADGIEVFVIDDNISEENKEKYLLTANKYNRKINFMDLRPAIKRLKELGAPSYRNSYTTYLKLFAFNLLPDYVHKILFIDSDTIVNGDLTDSMKIDMGESIVGAVKDGTCEVYKIALGYAKKDSWYNMGVMLVNVDKWKHENCEEKIITQFKIRNSYVAVDQDLLNITQHNNIYTLPIKYNITPHVVVYSYETIEKCMPQENYYSKEEVTNGKLDARIIHFERFIGESPWDRFNVHPFRKYYREYKAKSLWSDIKDSKRKKSFTMRIEKALYIILNKNTFFKIWAKQFEKYLIDSNNRMKQEKIDNIV